MAEQAKSRLSHQARERSPAFPLFADDWFCGTTDLPDDQCRMLIDFMALYWSLKGNITVAKFASKMHWDKRKFVRCLEALVEAGKIDLLADGKLGNSKMEELLTARKSRIDTHTDNVEVGPKSGVSSAEVQAKSDANIPENSTKSTAEPQIVAAPLPYLTLKEEKEERKIDLPASNLAVAASAAPADPGGLAGLNGATTEILETVAAWVNPLMPDRGTATRFLGTLFGSHGSAAVKTGFAALAAKLASGDLVARPLPLLAKMVADASRQPTASGGPAERRETQQEMADRAIVTNRAKRAAVAAAAQQGVH